MPETRISLDQAIDSTRTGDVWLFRGRTPADRAIQMTTNSPVNHVGMAVVIDDLPPLMWHAELGKSLPDMWSGTRHRGVQLHDLHDAVSVWGERYGQRAWLRQIDPDVSKEMEDAVLSTIARLDGTPFPSTGRLAAGWARGRIPTRPQIRFRPPQSSATGLLSRFRPLPQSSATERSAPREADLETAYCAEVVAVTYEAMGLLPAGRRASWYDPGRFWSGDDLRLLGGYRLAGEIAVLLASK